MTTCLPVATSISVKVALMPNCWTSGRAVVMSTMICWLCVETWTLSTWVLLDWPEPPVRSKIRSFCNSTAMRACGVPLGAMIGSIVTELMRSRRPEPPASVFSP